MRVSAIVSLAAAVLLLASAVAPVTRQDSVRGDVDGDASVDVFDVTYLATVAARRSVTSSTS